MCLLREEKPEYGVPCSEAMMLQVERSLLDGLPRRVSVETIICRHCIHHHSEPWKALMLINQKFYFNESNLYEERQSYSESALSQHIPLILSSVSSVNTVFKIIQYIIFIQKPSESCILECFLVKQQSYFLKLLCLFFLF